jgi:hypothetical protein
MQRESEQNLKLDKPRVGQALNQFADKLRMRGHEDLAFMIENYEALLLEEIQAAAPAPKPKRARKQL